MKKLFVWTFRIIVLVLIVKAVLWSWQKYQSGGQETAEAEVPDFNKVCRITNPDTGSCVCLHKQTNERLSLPYEECVKRARGG